MLHWTHCTCTCYADVRVTAGFTTKAVSIRNFVHVSECVMSQVLGHPHTELPLHITKAHSHSNAASCSVPALSSKLTGEWGDWWQCQQSHGTRLLLAFDRNFRRLTAVFAKVWIVRVFAHGRRQCEHKLQTEDFWLQRSFLHCRLPLGWRFFSAIQCFVWFRRQWTAHL